MFILSYSKNEKQYPHKTYCLFFIPLNSKKLRKHSFNGTIFSSRWITRIITCKLVWPTLFRSLAFSIATMQNQRIQEGSAPDRIRQLFFILIAFRFQTTSGTIVYCDRKRQFCICIRHFLNIQIHVFFLTLGHILGTSHCLHTKAVESKRACAPDRIRQFSFSNIVFPFKIALRRLCAAL